MNSSPARVSIFLLLITVFGLVFRLWHLGFGLPAYYHPDESAKLRVAQSIVEGKPVEYFRHPGFLVNSIAVSFRISEWLGLNETTSRLWWARLAVASLATLSIPLMGLIGLKLRGEPGAYFCAAALAVVPIHVLHSRYAKEDIHLTFSILLTIAMLLLWRAGPRKLASWSFAGVALGVALACSSKFIGAVMIPFAAIVILLSVPDVRRRVTGAVTILIVSLVVFGLFSHQMLHNPKEMWAEFQFELKHGTAPSRTPLNIYQWPDLGVYFLYTAILPGLGYVLPALGLVGGWIAWKCRREDANAIIVLCCAMLFYILAEVTPLKRAIGVERYALPAAVLMIPLAALAVDRCCKHSAVFAPGRYALITAVVLAIPLTQSALVSEQIDNDTRQQAQRWYRSNVPSGDFKMGYPSTLYIPEWTRQGPKHIVLCDMKKPLDEFSAMLQSVRWFTLTSFHTDRFEDFPRLNPKDVARIKMIRDEFPYAIIFREPFYRTMYFHQPVIEIRSREPFPGMEESRL